MMETVIRVENIKCGGCMNSIETKLNSVDGVSDIAISQEDGVISIQHSEGLDLSAIESMLAKMGYPPAGENNLGAKAKSYVSCMVGRVNA